MIKNKSLIFGLVGIVIILLIPGVLAQENKENKSEYNDISKLTIKDIEKGTFSDMKFINGSILLNATISNGIINHTSFFEISIVNSKIHEIIWDDPNPNEGKIVVDFIPLALKINEMIVNPLFFTFVMFSGIFFYRWQNNLKTQPYIKMRDEKLHKVELGRLISERPVDDCNFWEYKLKSAKGVKNYYSDRSFKEYEFFVFSKIAGILWYIPDLVTIKIDIPKEVKIFSRTPKKTPMNYVIYAFYLILNIISFKTLAMNIYEKLDFDTDDRKKIDFITCIEMLEQLDLRFNIEYENFELDQNSGKKQWNKKLDFRVSYNEIISKQRNKETVRKLNILEVLDEEIKFSTIREAIDNRRSKLMERARFESKKLKYEKQVEDSFNLYQKVLDENTALKMSEQQRYHDKIQKVYEVINNKNERLPEQLARVTTLQDLGVSDSEAIQKVLREELAKYEGKKQIEIVEENHLLKGKLSAYEELYKKDVKKKDEEAITIRTEYGVAAQNE